MKKLFCLKAKNGLDLSALSALPHCNITPTPTSIRNVRVQPDQERHGLWLEGLQPPSQALTSVTSREVNEARGGLIPATGRVRSKKKNRKKNKKKITPSKTYHESHSSPATVTTSRRCTKNHVPCVSQYSPAFIDTGFVEIGLVQLSQSAKTTNVKHTLTHRQIHLIMAPCTHPGMNKLFCL